MWSLSLNVLAYVVFSLRARARVDRAAAGRPVRSVRPDPDCAELPALALLGDGRGADHDRCPLSRRGAHAHLVRQLCLDARHQHRSEGGGGFPAAALCRASARLRDRRGLVPPRAVAAAAQAHGLDQGRAQAARRCQRRDPLQPRDPADRARPRAAGHRRVRQGTAPGLLESAVRRDSRIAAATHPGRHRARRYPAFQRRAQHAPTPTPSRRWCANGSRAISPAASRSSSASPSATWSWRCAQTRCRTAASSRPSPTSRRA